MMSIYTESNQGNGKGKRAPRRQPAHKHPTLLTLLLIIALHVLIEPEASAVPTMSRHEHTAWPTSQACWYVFVKLKFNDADPTKISWQFERIKEKEDDSSNRWGSVILRSDEHTTNKQDYIKEHCLPMGEYIFTIVNENSEEENGWFGGGKEIIKRKYLRQSMIRKRKRKHEIKIKRFIGMGDYIFTVVDDLGGEEIKRKRRRKRKGKRTRKCRIRRKRIGVEYWVTTNDMEVIAEGQLYFGKSNSTSFPLPTDKMQASED